MFHMLTDSDIQNLMLTDRDTKSWFFEDYLLPWTVGNGDVICKMSLTLLIS